MPLDEVQAVRYARHILLRQVGGVGQERLCASAVRIEGAGPALETAAAYLAAGGPPLEVGEGLEAGMVGAEEAGFLLWPGEERREAFVRGLGRLVPSAASGAQARSSRAAAVLASAPVSLPVPRFEAGPWVVLGGRPGARAGADLGVVLYASQGAGEGALPGPTGRVCGACLQARVRELGAPPSGASSVGLGALGALVVTQLLLGLVTGGGELEVASDGSWRAVEGACPHRPQGA